MDSQSNPDAGFAFALHGGAGVTPGRRYDRCEAHMAELATRCGARLSNGAAAIDVVEYAVAEMETSGLYVAGRGSAPNRAGFVEMDASIMDGATRKAGAVAAVRDLVSPVAAARMVMDNTPYVLMTGDGAKAFALDNGAALVHDIAAYYVLPEGVESADLAGAGQHGTVGAVALDRSGALAAATSTGGLFGKVAGRVGDTPQIGVGTWADGEIAVSCTGTGEHFILAGGAQRLACGYSFGGLSLRDSSKALLEEVGALGGDGGVIAISIDGEIALTFNSPGMKRASLGSGHPLTVGIT